MTVRINASKATKPTSKNAKNAKTKKKLGEPTGAKRVVKKLSALDAAARVLAETKKVLSCSELIEAMANQGYWTSPTGKTPQATLSAALQREIVVKKDQSRFKKTAPGRYTLA
jgi:hypothetical protein